MGDEDDHDCERIEIVDVALMKTPNIESCTYGDIVTFTIEVFNQGNVPLTNIVVEDYIPAGLGFTQSDNSDWTVGANRTIDGILPGASETITIDLEVLQTQGGVKDWTNYAEVISFQDGNGVDVSALDADSTTRFK